MTSRANLYPYIAQHCPLRFDMTGPGSKGSGVTDSWEDGKGKGKNQGESKWILDPSCLFSKDGTLSKTFHYVYGDQVTVLTIMRRCQKNQWETKDSLLST